MPKLEGVYAAAVTPFTDGGEVDYASLARLLAWFEAAGCAGVALGATNGEGPSLSAVEKRDILREAARFAGGLQVIAGVLTSSLSEAKWLASQAADSGAVATLAISPFYYRSAPDEGVIAWFWELMDASELPVIVYNYPKMCGRALTPEMLKRLVEHERFGGVKDSSGERGNIAPFRAAVPDHPLFEGNETLLVEALAAGWDGAISGCANPLPKWVVRLYSERDAATDALLRPILEPLRAAPQPAVNKWLLRGEGVLESDAVRAPLMSSEAPDLRDAIVERLGAVG